ncbi:MAG: OmpH family outer membrane protein [Bacteroidia bacterium]
MRTILINVFLSLAVSIGAVLLFHKYNAPKIGYIKSALLLQDYKEMIEVTEQFNNELKIVQTNSDTLQNRFEKLKQEGPLITEKEKNNWSYKLGIAQSEYEKYSQQASEQMQSRRTELTKKVLETVNNFIQKYGKENNYQFIFGTTEDGSILYGMESDDLTQTILDLLNQSYQPKADAKAGK